MGNTYSQLHISCTSCALFFVFLIHTIPGWSQDALKIERNSTFPQDISQYLYVYGGDNKIGISDINGENGLFEKLDKKTLYPEKTLWGKVEFQNNTGNDISLVVQVSNDFEAGDLYGYLFQDNLIIQTMRGGHFLKPLPKDIPYTHNPNIRFTLPAQSTSLLLIKNIPVEGYNPSFSAVLHSEYSFHEQIKSRDFFQAVFQGVILFLFFYNLILFLQTRDRTFLYYSVYMIGFSIFSIILHGYQFFLFNTSYLPLIFSSAAIVSWCSYALFLRKFVNTKVLFPQLDRLVVRLLPSLYIIGACSSAFLIIYPQEYKVMDNILKIIAPVFFLLHLTFPVRLLLSRNTIARYAAIGSLLLCIGLIAAIIDNVYFENQDTIYGQIGILAELLIFSVGLGNRIKIVEREKRETQTLLIQQLKENEDFQTRMNKELEQRIHSRTEEVTLRKQELEEKTKELEIKNTQLRKANNFKNKLFAIIAHDLKNPLGTLKGVLELNRKGHLTREELQELSTSLDKSLAEIMNMLDNLLTWAVREVNNTKVKKQLIPLDMLVCEAIELLLPQAESKNIEVKFISREKYMIYVDIEMIRLVIRNLLANAIKFTHTGGEIVVKAGQDEKSVWVKICDNGKGMSQETLDKLFSLEVVSTPGTANEKGTGLGLKLCHEFVSKNGGRIYADSQEGVGSCFTVETPVPEKKSEAFELYTS